jgi:hypothetical protein
MGIVRSVNNQRELRREVKWPETLDDAMRKEILPQDALYDRHDVQTTEINNIPPLIDGLSG